MDGFLHREDVSMDIRDVVDMDGEPEIPINACVYRMQDYGITDDFSPGRILLGHYNDGRENKIYPELFDHLKPTDIVYIPLYGGKRWHGPESRWMSDDTSDRIPLYEENLSILREIAPFVRAILVGNVGPEVSFKHLCLFNGMSASDNISVLCDFVRQTGDMIKDAGGTPCYGVIDWDLAMDCYCGDGRYNHLINEMDGITICFCGFHLFGMGTLLVPDPKDPHCWPYCPFQEWEPWPIMSRYIGELKNSISGVDSSGGLRARNDVSLKRYGFKEGAMGETHGYERLINIKGE